MSIISPQQCQCVEAKTPRYPLLFVVADFPSPCVTSARQTGGHVVGKDESITPAAVMGQGPRATSPQDPDPGSPDSCPLSCQPGCS